MLIGPTMYLTARNFSQDHRVKHQMPRQKEMELEREYTTARYLGIFNQLIV
jgi:hypothetical protein